jgi:hypothetical protein
MMRSWKKPNAGKVYDPAPKRPLPLKSCSMSGKDCTRRTPMTKGWEAFRGGEELVPQPRVFRSGFHAASKAERNRSAFWISDSSFNLSSQC